MHGFCSLYKSSCIFTRGIIGLSGEGRGKRLFMQKNFLCPTLRSSKKKEHKSTEPKQYKILSVAVSCMSWHRRVFISTLRAGRLPAQR